jgi:uncharacterized protein (DUF736 family)
MSDYKPYPNTGSLTKNQRKTEDKHPDLRGDIHVTRDLLQVLMKEEGELVQISISAWTKMSKAGNKYLSLQASAPYKKEAPKPQALDDDDDDAPF